MSLAIIAVLAGAMIFPEPSILIVLSLPTDGDGDGVGVKEGIIDIEGVMLMLGVTVTEGVTLILGVTVTEGVTLILGVTVTEGVTDGVAETGIGEAAGLDTGTIGDAPPDPDICAFAAPCPLLLFTLVIVC
jgi:hypothetical protein